jgi:outer membrane protein OmpA-like peptidoglycan-associated protein
MSIRPFGILVTAMLPVWLGCAAALPPKELLDARDAFAQASAGPAAQQDPADVEVARQALNRAEEAFASAPEADATRDLAYVAQVKSLTADARGRLAATERARAVLEAQAKLTAVNKLDSKNAALAADATALANETARTEATSAALIAEQKRRAAAETKLREAMDRLSALAAIKEEPRGTVITISGSVLFATDKSALLPIAAERLNEVADALNLDENRSVTVFGFTDSTGDATHNQTLSEQRAEAVRDYLIARGVSKDRLTAVGKGPSDPVATNGTAEGRANNRRVEIVIAHAKDNDSH